MPLFGSWGSLVFLVEERNARHGLPRRLEKLLVHQRLVGDVLEYQRHFHLPHEGIGRTESPFNVFGQTLPQKLLWRLRAMSLGVAVGGIPFHCREEGTNDRSP